MSGATIKNPPITATEARERLAYDPATGVLRWKHDRSNMRAGSVAGSPTSTGHRAVGWGGRKLFEHRLIWLIVHGEWPAEYIDHIDGNRSNKCLTNLRQVSNAENTRNRKGRGRSGYKGVHYHGKPNRRHPGKCWRVAITVSGREMLLGSYECKEEAAAVARAAFLERDGLYRDAA